MRQRIVTTEVSTVLYFDRSKSKRIVDNPLTFCSPDLVMLSILCFTASTTSSTFLVAVLAKPSTSSFASFVLSPNVWAFTPVVPNCKPQSNNGELGQIQSSKLTINTVERLNLRRNITAWTALKRYQTTAKPPQLRKRLLNKRTLFALFASTDVDEGIVTQLNICTSTLSLSKSKMTRAVHKWIKIAAEGGNGSNTSDNHEDINFIVIFNRVLMICSWRCDIWE